MSTASTLLRRAKHIPNTSKGQIDETKHVISTLNANGYERNQQITSHKEVTPPQTEDSVQQFFNLVDPVTKKFYHILEA